MYYRPRKSFFGSFTFIEMLIVAGIVLTGVSLVGGAVVSLVGGAFPNYSEGERSGTVYKISKKGLLFKSYEGEMNLGGMAADANGQMVANSFKFSVKDPAIVEQINAASNSGKRVTLTYTQYFIKPIKLDTQYVVVGVKGIEK